MRVNPHQFNLNRAQTNSFGFRNNSHALEHSASAGIIMRQASNLGLYKNVTNVDVTDFIPLEPFEIREDGISCRKILKNTICAICQLFFTLLLLYYSLHIIYKIDKFNDTVNYVMGHDVEDSPAYKINEDKCYCHKMSRIEMEKIDKTYLNYNDIVFKIKAIMDELHFLRLEVALLHSKFGHLKIDEKITEAIDRYDADKIGIIDYALEHTGGAIISLPDTTPYPSQMTYNVLGLLSVQYSSNPRVVIQPTTQPGECFAFHGSCGKIRIHLAREINITAFTMEHAHRSLLVDTASAPKQFAVYGLTNVDSQIGDLLGRYTYNIEGKPLQIFNVTYTESPKSYKNVELQILSNYGKKEYTCIYRLRVHGNDTESRGVK